MMISVGWQLLKKRQALTTITTHVNLLNVSLLQLLTAFKEQRFLLPFFKPRLLKQKELTWDQNTEPLPSLRYFAAKTLNLLYYKWKDNFNSKLLLRNKENYKHSLKYFLYISVLICKYNKLFICSSVHREACFRTLCSKGLEKKLFRTSELEWLSC